MRIAFVTSCLEPGKDGVGDYTRDLAAACRTEGCDSQLIALNDRYVGAPLECAQTTRGTAIETLRLPASAPWHDRVPAAARFLQQRPADWISLQFVCYGFHPKGITIGLGRHLAPLIGDRRLHVMLHELWIGARRGAGLRERVVGSIQRQAVCSLIARLKPAAVHTSNAGYAQLLAKAGIHARLLPLCGSIPIVPDVDAAWLERELRKLGATQPAHAPDGESWRFGFFGVLPEPWAPEPLFTYIAEAAERAGRAVAVLSIGRIGSGEGLWRDMQARYGHRFLFARLGERSPAEVSMFLQSIDCGIATSPWQLIGKSASTAAMLDHGLPVIVPRDDVDIGAADGLEDHDPLLQRMTAALPQWLLRVRRREPRESSGALSARFIADIRAVDTGHPLSLDRPGSSGNTSGCTSGAQRVTDVSR
jgi:hypothetical protein